MGDVTGKTTPRSELAPGLFGVSVTSSRPTDDPPGTTRNTNAASTGSLPCPEISIVIPVHNEQSCLPELHRRLALVMQATRRSYEILFVDDGSHDESLTLMRRFSRQDAHTRYIGLTRNFGQAAAVAAGQRAARGLGLITMDCDLQNPPEEIPKLLAKFDEGYEVVYGIRAQRQDSWLRRACSAAMTKVLETGMGVPGRPCLTAFMITHRRIVDELNRCPELTRFYPTLCAWLGARTARVELRHETRLHGNSRYSYARLAKIAADLFTGYTTAPLGLAFGAGFLCVAAGSAMACWSVLQTWVYSSPLLGPASVLSAISTIGGLQLLAIGIVGSYLGRTYAQLLQRPLYVVRHTSEDRASMKTATALRLDVERMTSPASEPVGQPIKFGGRTRGR
ncbi:MAG: glycosyltransferase family 2 protein [Planctomycetes bacterium]|nr:glycosyltransferase family 2 protein [Planctomycetota bacterium]